MRKVAAHKQFLGGLKAQSLVELALFGSIILLVFGSLLSYSQSLNDQQYEEMDAFRRALEKANTHRGSLSGGAGASVQFTRMENRRLVDLTSGYKKGSPSSSGSSADVFWAVPKVGNDSESLVVYRINEDEVVNKPYTDFVATDQDYNESFRVENTEISTETDFGEVTTKNENSARIQHTRQMNLQDTINTRITYTIRANDTGDEDPVNDPILREGELVDVTQGVYLEDGKYKYSQAALNQTVVRGKRWETEF